MTFKIRPLRPSEHVLLDRFLYEAIFIPEGVQRPPMSIVEVPELRVYVDGFGMSPHDCCLVAEAGGEVVGCCLARIMDDFGHVDDETPSLLISVLEPHRGRGMGTSLMQAMLGELEVAGYGQVSLSVQKENPAVHLYQRLGFEVVGESDEEFIMVRRLGQGDEREGRAR